MSNEEDVRIYRVIRNEEGQYSLWLGHKVVPEGWESVGETGSKAECVQYVDEVWTDMRPLSLVFAGESIQSGSQ